MKKQLQKNIQSETSKTLISNLVHTVKLLKTQLEDSKAEMALVQEYMTQAKRNIEKQVKEKIKKTIKPLEK